MPQTYVTMTGEDDVKNMNKLIDMLEDNEDVQNVWHNCSRTKKESCKKTALT